MFAKRLLTLFCGLALFGAVHSSEVSHDSFEMIAGTHESLPRDLVGSLIAAAEDEEEAAEEGMEDEEARYIRPFYYRRPAARTIVIGANQIPSLMHHYNTLPRQLRWVPARYPHIVVRPSLARSLLARLYRSNPENVYQILRALPYRARNAVRRLISHAANPAAYKHICASFLSSYAKLTSEEMSMLEAGEEVNEEAEEEVEENNSNDAATVSLEKLAAGLENQAVHLEKQVAAMKIKVTDKRPKSFLNRKRGAAGRRPTHPSRVVNPEGMHSWDAVAKANVLTGEAGQKPIGSPIAPQHAEYLSVVAFPKE